MGETQETEVDIAIKDKIEGIYYDLIPEIVEVCASLNFQQADELIEQANALDTPLLVRCTNKTWKKTTISELADEAGLTTLIKLYTVRYLGGPSYKTLFETHVNCFVADRVLVALKHWDGDCDDLIELLANYWAENNGALTDAN